MIKVIEAKGDTIDKAIQNALNILGCDRDDVSVEVVSKPKSGFLGFGKEPAMVKVTYETSPAGKAKDFLEGLLIRFGTPAHIDA
ncbi:MAG: Jag N-terminal domain-containing protein, partial [Clostridiaceae bacterium]|nr:Jag N-terminal domain-containing protein [Clostridiaceae bacterium]